MLTQIDGPTNMSNFHPREVLCRGSGTQLHVGKNINCIIFKLHSLGALMVNKDGYTKRNTAGSTKVMVHGRR